MTEDSDHRNKTTLFVLAKTALQFDTLADLQKQCYSQLFTNHNFYQPKFETRHKHNKSQITFLLIDDIQLKREQKPKNNHGNTFAILKKAQRLIPSLISGIFRQQFSVHHKKETATLAQVLQSCQSFLRVRTKANFRIAVRLDFVNLYVLRLRLQEHVNVNIPEESGWQKDKKKAETNDKKEEPDTIPSPVTAHDSSNGRGPSISWSKVTHCHFYDDKSCVVCKLNSSHC